MAIRILQTNLGRAWAAHDLAYAYSKKNNIDVLIVSEPNQKLVGGGNWLKDSLGNVAVLCINKKVGVHRVVREEGYLCISMDKWDIYCCYISPNVAFGEYQKTVDMIMDGVLKGGRKAVVLGDINSKSPQWGSPTVDCRGEYFTEWMAALDMIAINTGDKPTFTRGRSCSYIDVTCATSEMAAQIKEWQVLEVENLSYHKYIYFMITEMNIPPRETARVNRDSKIFAKSHIINKECFQDSLYIRVNSERNKDVNTRMNIIRQAYRDSVNDSGGRHDRNQPYWWDPHIARKRDECTKQRRELLRINRRGEITAEERPEKENTYKDTRRDLRRLINKSKRQHWERLRDELNNDIWGDGYKIVMRSLKGLAPYELPLQTKKEVAGKLFLQTEDRWNSPGTEDEINLFTQEEMTLAVNRLRIGKAPGLDSIPTEAIREAYKCQPEWIAEIMNNLVKDQAFPEEWKIARLVLIPKPGKDLTSWTAYRPLCLLNGGCKLYEYLIKERLEEEIKNKGGLHRNQYGFIKGVSTTHAVNKVRSIAVNTRRKWCALITIDVANAFNTASHSIIIRELTRRGISRYLIELISNYFTNRRIQIEAKEIMKTGAGVPQGSVLGPLLWNVLYDGVLRLDLGMDVATVAYADDLALVVCANGKEALIGRVNGSLRRIAGWMETNKLRLAPEKTEAVILKGKRKRDGIQFAINGALITPKRNIRYLGIYLDDRGSFGEHVIQVTKKAESRLSKISRLMPNIKGPTSNKREVLCGVVHSILLYGAPVWARACAARKYREMLSRTQRRALVRIASAYRTVSAEALQVITGVIPIDLQVEERRATFDQRYDERRMTRQAARENSIAAWQRRWDLNVEKGQWTKRLIPTVDVWYGCKFRRLDYFLTQALTGHGSFRAYTHKIGKEADDTCVYCGHHDTACHTIFECDRWVRIRTEAHTSLGHGFGPEDMVEIMVRSKNNWEVIHCMIRRIMKAKETEERVRQGL